MGRREAAAKQQGQERGKAVFYLSEELTAVLFVFGDFRL